MRKIFNGIVFKSRIVISILFSFSIAFTILFLVLDSVESTKLDMSCLKDSDLKKKIFILGSSQVGNIDAVFIDSYISKSSTEGEYIVYNLAVVADDPTRRTRQLEQIISAKPVLVTYGLGYSDFEGQTYPIHPLFDTKQFSHDLTNIFFKNFVSYDFAKFENPKFTLFMLFKNFFGEAEIFCNESNSPFYTPRPNHTIINKDVLKEESRSIVENKINPSEDDRVRALKKIIAGLQKNNIKVILFITPFSAAYLDTIPDSEKKIFHSIMKNISKEFNVKIYFLEEKYLDLNVWSDPTHIAFNKDSIIYSDDVAKIIFSEISP